MAMVAPRPIAAASVAVDAPPRMPSAISVKSSGAGAGHPAPRASARGRRLPPPGAGAGSRAAHAAMTGTKPAGVRSPGETPARNIRPIGVSARVPQMMKGTKGGTGDPSVPPAATDAVARPIRGISGTQMRLMVEAQAMDEPVIAEKLPQPTAESSMASASVTTRPNSSAIPQPTSISRTCRSGISASEASAFVTMPRPPPGPGRAAGRCPSLRPASGRRRRGSSPPSGRSGPRRGPGRRRRSTCPPDRRRTRRRRRRGHRRRPRGRGRRPPGGSPRPGNRCGGGADVDRAPVRQFLPGRLVGVHRLVGGAHADPGAGVLARPVGGALARHLTRVVDGDDRAEVGRAVADRLRRGLEARAAPSQVEVAAGALLRVIGEPPRGLGARAAVGAGFAEDRRRLRCRGRGGRRDGGASRGCPPTGRSDGPLLDRGGGARRRGARRRPVAPPRRGPIRPRSDRRRARSPGRS